MRMRICVCVLTLDECVASMNLPLHSSLGGHTHVCLTAACSHPNDFYMPEHVHNVFLEHAGVHVCVIAHTSVHIVPTWLIAEVSLCVRPWDKTAKHLHTLERMCMRAMCENVCAFFVLDWSCPLKWTEPTAELWC